jgi:hypothetical protein
MAFKLNPLTGQLDLVGSATPAPENFSYETVALGVTVTIPIYQQMIVQGAITIIGTLVINGTLVII